MSEWTEKGEEKPGAKPVGAKAAAYKNLEKEKNMNSQMDKEGLAQEL